MRATDIRNGHDFNRYDEQEWKKAFLKGTDRGWKTYNMNMKQAQMVLDEAYRRELVADRA